MHASPRALHPTNRPLCSLRLRQVCSLDCARTDTQATVWADLRGRQAIVSFRGTEQVKFQDILTDINLAQVTE